MSLCAVLLGSVGVLVGARLDFGYLGLATLADWCRTLQPAGLDSVRAQLASAPWTHVGMLLGCNLGMALSAWSFDRGDASRPVLGLRFAACNAGMLLGMYLAESLLASGSAADEGGPAASGMLLAMVVGMTAGMAAGWWSVEWLLRRRRGHARDAALRDASCRNSEIAAHETVPTRQLVAEAHRRIFRRSDKIRMIPTIEREEAR
jgi:hypothetical protein